MIGRFANAIERAVFCYEQQTAIKRCEWDERCRMNGRPNVLLGVFFKPAPKTDAEERGQDS
jgi:hypothetical protein